MMRSHNHSQRGLSLVEVMAVAVILVAITVIAMMTLSGNQERQRLLSAAHGVTDVFVAAQKQAMAENRIIGVCFKSAANGTFVQAYVPTLAASGLPTDSDCFTGEPLQRYKAEFGPTVTLCATCDANIALNKSVFFSTQGFPIIQNGNSATFQICLVNSRLPSGARAREIEVTSGGITALVKPGLAGDIASLQANTGNCQ